MAVRLDIRSSDFAQKFRAFLDTKRESAADVEAAVRIIVNDVARRGDAALADYTRKFDRLDLDRTGMKVTADEIAAAVKACSRETLDALEFARARIEAYHLRQMPKDDRFTDALGVELGSRWTAIEAVGLYVPGGTAAYPSSVLMNAVPAKVAGVPRIAMVVPAPGGELNPLVLAAAKLAGVDEIFRIGGAQAISETALGQRAAVFEAMSLRSAAFAGDTFAASATMTTASVASAAAPGWRSSGGLHSVPAAAPTNRQTTAVTRPARKIAGWSIVAVIRSVTPDCG